MARRKRARRRPKNVSENLHHLESQLLLLGWANRQFGFISNEDLFSAMKGVREGYDRDGRSHVARLLGSRDACLIPLGDLARYDGNVRRHLRTINANRSEPVTLRYFQQLAALYAELFLDRRAFAPDALAREVHDYVRWRAPSLPVLHPIHGIDTADLNKLAFWMATGSGKTLIMHLNYLQFLHYGGDERLDNIILITPNEGLSAQHQDEFDKSGILSVRLGESGLFARHPRTVQVTEITKLVEKRRGKGTGVSIEVDALGNRNLVFVDEGHRGASGDAWRTVRDAVAKRGFTFEYSATFGQALAAARHTRLIADYGKSIVFDYSYRYFHRDGFGKDFRVLNVSGRDPAPELTDLLLLGNLLSFYEQLCAFRDNAPELRAYNLEQPLWIFVGGSVNAVYKRRRRDTSDVLTVQRFLHRVLSEPDWTKNAISKLLQGESGLYVDWNVDVFAGRFKGLVESGMTPESIYTDILSTVFHASGPGGLRLCDIRGAPGELGLKAAGSERYFGLTYIGDTGRFKKLVHRAGEGIVLEQDAVGGSLFGRVNESGATINVLIGAKKFVEGWNSWRVSTMGLMNVGRAEGAQIIQLFGRGVRLKGKGMSLKRSAYLKGAHPKSVELLETLNIFAIRADYMRKFREYLETEGMETRDTVSLRVPVRANDKFLKRGLLIPSAPNGSSFEQESNFSLLSKDMPPIRIDRATRATSWKSGSDQQQLTEGSAGVERPARDLPLGMVDWEAAYLDLVEHRRVCGMYSLAVPRSAALKRFVECAPVSVAADDHIFSPRKWRDREDLQDIVHTILRQSVDKLWQIHRKRWESRRMTYQKVDESNPNLLLNVDRAAAAEPEAARQSHYVVSVPRDQPNLFSQVEELVDQQSKLYERESAELARIYFDRHLYQPLLIEGSNPAVTVSPPPLNNSEAIFVKQLRRFWRERGQDLYPETELFLLRNQGRGRGVGFFVEEAGFYPDFILWMIAGDHQRIVFVEPHGMISAKAYNEDEKAKLHEWLRDLTADLALRSRLSVRVTLDSFIVSATDYGDLRPRYGDGSWSEADFAAKHILFPDEEGRYLEAMLSAK